MDVIVMLITFAAIDVTTVLKTYTAVDLMCKEER